MIICSPFWARPIYNQRIERSFNVDHQFYFAPAASRSNPCGKLSKPQTPADAGWNVDRLDWLLVQRKYYSIFSIFFRNFSAPPPKRNMATAPARDQSVDRTSSTPEKDLATLSVGVTLRGYQRCLADAAKTGRNCIVIAPTGFWHFFKIIAINIAAYHQAPAKPTSPPRWFATICRWKTRTALSSSFPMEFLTNNRQINCKITCPILRWF